jgi:hypothetical protein
VTYHPPARQPASPPSRFDRNDRALPCPDGHWAAGTFLRWYQADFLDELAAELGLPDGAAVLAKACGDGAPAALRTASRDQIGALLGQVRAWAGIRHPAYGAGDVVCYGSTGIYSYEAGWGGPGTVHATGGGPDGPGGPSRR